ncbi:MAG TPA: hypothetical protein VFJ58_12050 [Armatimonadota bacterium]|nr:hypothetical protein [Armatimonadota bacterium]
MTDQADGETPACSESLLAAVRQITDEHPRVPLLALGQTVFWDEPIKAVVRKAMSAAAPDAKMVLAVHDTDYFARPHATLASAEPFLVLPHNDGSTQNLWCAAGELSQLFGGETVLTRSALRSAGARLDIAAQARDETLHDLVDRVTEAWGWRGIAHTSGVETLTYEVPIRAVIETLIRLLDWGFSASARTLCRCTGPEQAEAVASQVRAFIDAAAGANPDGSLSDLYQALLPQMYALAGGEDLGGFEVSHSLAESRFNGETASRPRFRIVDLFLNPDSRDICATAYNNAVHGSEIYGLDRFGAGAIPFDVVTPEIGRGVLRITDEGVHVEGRSAQFIPTVSRVESVSALAAVLNERYGNDISLVGKAVTWIAILAAEFIFVFHEGASAYTRRTRQMLEEMRRHGVVHDVNPILRVRHSAWDALAEVRAGFCLPDHYAEAFGEREISARRFSERWRMVMDEQESLLLELGQLRRPVDLLHFLANRGGPWPGRLHDYLNARGVIRAANGSAPEHAREAKRLREEHYRAGIEIDHLQKQLGEFRRRRLAEAGSSFHTGRDPDSEFQAIDGRMAQLREHRNDLKARQNRLKREASVARSSESYRQAQATRLGIESHAELERIELARRAYLVVHSLESNNRRPTGWWLPMVSPDGAWFNAICRSASGYIEPL